MNTLALLEVAVGRSREEMNALALIERRHRHAWSPSGGRGRVDREQIATVGQPPRLQHVPPRLRRAATAPGVTNPSGARARCFDHARHLACSGGIHHERAHRAAMTSLEEDRARERRAVSRSAATTSAVAAAPQRAAPAGFEARSSPQAPALDPAGFDALSDDLVRHILLRERRATHGTLHAVCKRLASVLRSDDFTKLRVEAGAAEYGVVLAGGMRGAHARAEGWMLRGGRWASIPPMSGARLDVCSVVAENELWVLGGQDDRGKVLATAEAYSPATNAWRALAPLRQRRCGAVAGVVGGRVVVAGGAARRGRLTSAEACAEGGGWAPLPPLPHAAVHATACALNGRLYGTRDAAVGDEAQALSPLRYVMGGVDCDKLQVLEPAAGPSGGYVWTVKADLRGGTRHGAASAVVDGRIWLIGGCAAPDGWATDAVDIYDADADAWRAGPALPAVDSNLVAATLDGDLYVHGPQGAWAYRNASWTAVPGGPERFCPACATVLLG